MMWLFTLLGVVLIVAGLNDIFHTLLRPTGRGHLSHFVVNGMWKAFRGKGGFRKYAGPLAIVCVILTWTALQAVGWALIYYPHFPDGFSYSAGLDETRYSNAAEALYVSVMTLSTLGYGDVVPIDNWIRWASTFQAVTGFGLLTAAVSWFMQIYPALSRRRTLALKLSSMSKSGYVDKLCQLEPSVACSALESVSDSISHARIDLSQTTETYYFRDMSPDVSLAVSLSYALDLSAAGQRSPSKDVNLTAEVLETSLTELAGYLRDEFALEGTTTRDVFRAFEADHGHRD
ncbi:Ion channel [Arthrobacter sp. VKM Ac-2550]|nr:Ion channel [Arthrobacter sp. VKM Ac-2550]